MSGLLDNLYFDVNGLSKHFGGQVEYNERNPGFGLTHETVKDGTVKGLLAGTYKNSFNDRSFYAGGHYGKRFGKDYYMDLGVSGGLISGYEKQTGKKVVPMAGLMAQFGKKDLGRIKLQYVPRLESKSPSVLMMNLGIPFK